MKYLIYISSAVKLMSEEELTGILYVSRRNNTAAHITGMMIYSEGTFIQVIEGYEDDLKKLFQKIELDPRHKNIIKLIELPLKERNFPDWSMAFVTPNAYDLEELDGYINPANPNFMQTTNVHAAITLLKTFVKNNKITNNL